MLTRKTGGVWRNLRWGLQWGLGLATIYCAYVIVLFLLRGSTPFDAHDTSVPALLAVYFFGGLAGGALVGLLRPLVKNVWAAMLVGVLVAAPVMVGIAFASDGPPTNWDESAVFAIRAGTLLFGLSGGFIAWRWWRD